MSNYAQRSQRGKKEFILYDFIFKNSRLCETIYNDQKQIAVCVGMAGGGGAVRRSNRKTLQRGINLRGNGYTLCFDYGCFT